MPGLVAACCGPVKTTTETVTVPGPTQFIPVPPALTAPCVHEETPETVGELLVAYENARATIEECNGRLEQIRGLK
jgi:hypothetical protein